MQTKTMTGVVLWTETVKGTAIIWCDDHGDLAFLRPNGENITHDCAICVGDVIRFDIDTLKKQRLALHPTVLARRKYPDIGNMLMDVIVPANGIFAAANTGFSVSSDDLVSVAGHRG